MNGSCNFIISGLAGAAVGAAAGYGAAKVIPGKHDKKVYLLFDVGDGCWRFLVDMFDVKVISTKLTNILLLPPTF